MSRLDAAKEVVGRFVQDRAERSHRPRRLRRASRTSRARSRSITTGCSRTSPASTRSQLSDGTAIGSAIASGVRRLDAQGAKSKILIVLTDGQNNAGKIQPRVAAEAAKALGVKVYTIGVGSTGEALVPVTDDHGRQQLVTARVDVDEAGMKQVAEVTGGTFYRATDTQSLRDVYADIDRFEKTTRTIKGFTPARRAVRLVRGARPLSRARGARPVGDALSPRALLDLPGE